MRLLSKSKIPTAGNSIQNAPCVRTKSPPVSKRQLPHKSCVLDVPDVEGCPAAVVPFGRVLQNLSDLIVSIRSDPHGARKRIRERERKSSREPPLGLDLESVVPASPEVFKTRNAAQIRVRTIGL